MKNIFSIVKFTALLVVLFSVIYTMAILGIAQFAPNKGKGETISVNGKVVGYQKIGQKFDKPNYFWGRPSAVDYNAAGSAGSNKGPFNPDYLKLVQDRIDTFLVHNPGVKKEEIPADMVTASGSGLDPDLSPASAHVQVKRIAAARNLPEIRISDLVDQHIEKVFLGMGPEKVNVLKINIDLDNLK